MNDYDSTGWEFERFDYRPDAPSFRPRHHAMKGHGPGCSSNPEVGCVCGEEEAHYDRLERAEMRRFPNAAAEGVQRWLVVDGEGTVHGDWMDRQRADAQALPSVRVVAA